MASSASLSLSSSLNQPPDHVAIFNIIFNRQNEGLQDADYDEIETILANCDVNARLIENNNETLMHVAAREQNEKLFKLFYNHGGDLFAKNLFNETPRDIAMVLECINIRKFIDDVTITFEDEEFFLDANKTKAEQCKSIKLNDSDDLNEIFFSNDEFNYCEIFPNLFAFKVLGKTNNEKILIDKIHNQLNDNRPLLIYFIKSSQIYYKRENSDEFKVADVDMSEEIQAIINHIQIPLSLVEKICKSNDKLLLRILKLRKSLDESKIIESVLKLCDNIDMFRAVIYEPFTEQMHYFIDSNKIIYNTNVVELAIQHDKIDAVNYLIENFTQYLQYLPFWIKKYTIDYIFEKKITNYEAILYELIKFDFPFPENVETINDEIIQKFLQDREILKSNDLEIIKQYVNENKSTKIGYDRNNKPALVYAIESKMFNNYSYLLSIGFRTDNDKELKDKIDALTDKEKGKIEDQNAFFAHSDSKNHLRLLTNKFGIFTYYEDKEQYEQCLNNVFKCLEELDSIDRCKPLLRFCADMEILKVTLDFDSKDVNKTTPYGDGSIGLTCPKGLIFVAGKQSFDEIKKTIIHELCHFAVNQFYENNFKPYYFNDDENSKRFENITSKILAFIKLRKDSDKCFKIISQILTYNVEKHQSEMIVRAFEILVHFNGEAEKINNLPTYYAPLFDYVDEHVVKALSSEELKCRTNIRNFNAYNGLLQNINEANKRLMISEDSDKNEIFDKIFQNQKNYLIVSNVPILVLINIKGHLYNTRESLYNAKNIFLDPKQLKNVKKLADFKKLQEIVLSAIIVDISNGHENNNFSQERKLIFVTSGSRLIESENYLGNFYFDYDKIDINYEWRDLCQVSQEKLAEKVYFQGKEFKLSELVNDNLTIENIIDDEVFVDICDKNKIININSHVDQLDFYIKRKFKKIQMKKKLNEHHDSNFKRMHSLQKTLAKHKVKLSKQKNIEEAFADSLTDFLTKTEHCSKILISDIAGSGKSYVLKKISHELMSKCDSQNNYWVLFIDLRKFLNEFHKWNGEKDFLSFFHSHLGRNLKNFEKKIFEIFYNSGKAKILLDGFDEISPKCKDIVIDFMKSIKLDRINDNLPSTSASESIKTQNQLIITTRQHLEFDLRNCLEISEIFSLKSLETDEEATEFLVAYWKTKNINLIKVCNLNDLAQDVIVKFREMKLTDRNLIGKVQQLKILAEICLQNDEIKIESLTSFKMYDIYERSVQKFIDNWRNRDDCQELVKKIQYNSSPNFVVNHQHRALLESIDKDIEPKFFSHLGRMWSLEEIEKGGLVTFENDKVYFIHTTYLEFFIANFIIQSLENSIVYSGHLIELFCQIMFVPFSTTTQMFFNDKIQNLSFSTDIIEIFAKHFSSKLTDFNVLKHSIRHNHENFFNFLIKVIEKVDDEKRKQILMSEPEYPLYQSLESSNTSIFNEILRVTSEYLTDDEFIELLRKQINNRTIFHLFYLDHVTYEMMNSLMLILERKLNNNTNCSMNDFLLCKGGNFDNLPIQILLLDTQPENLTKFENLWRCHFNHMSLEELIENSADIDGENILHYIASNLNMLVHEKLWEQCKKEFQSNKKKLNEHLFKRNKFEKNYLQILISEKKSSVEILKLDLSEIEKVCDMKKVLSRKDEDLNELPIQTLLKHTNAENLDKFEYFYDYNLKYMSSEEIIRKSEDDLLPRNENNCSTIKLLMCKSESWNGLPIQLLLYSIKSDNLDKFEHFWDYYFKYVSLEELIEKSNDESDNNILHYIAECHNIFVHKKLWQRCVIEFQSNKKILNQLLLKTDGDNLNFLHRLVCAEKSTVEILAFNLKEISKFIDDSVEIFTSKGKDENTLLQHALINQKTFDFFKTLWDFLRISFARDVFVKHIKELNSENLNVIHVALKMTENENKDEKNFVEFMKKSLKKDLKMSRRKIKSLSKVKKEKKKSRIKWGKITGWSVLKRWIEGRQ